MKTILVACGSGMVTSVVIQSAVDRLLQRNNLHARLIQCRFSQLDDYLEDADLVITSARLQDRFSKPTVAGGGFLTGEGTEALERRILDFVRET